ncbi:MAG: hypothetical protein IJ899_07830 [Blautia sp.]|nr:hypothetical protein [Blautia sp.]
MSVYQVADQNGVPTEEVRDNIGEIINYLWMQPANDTHAQVDLKIAFPDGKPSVEEFIEFIAGMVKKKDDDLPFNRKNHYRIE